MNMMSNNISPVAPNSNLPALAEQDSVEIEKLISTIDVASPLTVASFGGKIGEQTGSYTDSLLKQARNSDMDDMGDKLGDIVVAAQSFDLSALDNKWMRAPIIGGFLSAIMKGKAKAMSHFDSIEGQVNKLVGDVGSIEERLIERSKTLDAMYDGVQREQKSLLIHAHAADQRLPMLGQDITVLQNAPASSDALEKMGALEASYNALEKRRDDLIVLHHAALQALPMIRMIQANNLVLVEKFRTIQTLTLPTWKRTFLMALALDEQKEAVDLANNIDDATNYFMKRNSELLKENAVATAKANQRLVVDVDTLRTVHENIVQTLNDVRKVHEEGVEERASALTQLSDLRQQMDATIGNVQKAPA